MVAPPTGTVAFLFTDIEGSTRLWEDHEAAMTDALALHDGVMRSAIDSHDGYVFSTAGDAFAAAFESCTDAIAAASEIQGELRRTEWPTPEPVAVRIGLHVGEADERDGDYFGPTLNRAARIMSAAHGGQIVTSSAFRQLVPNVDLRDLGRHRLKDLASADQLWQFGDGHFPTLRTLDAIRHNLPVERTPLVGRAEEIERVTELVDEHRLVTVVGIGGTGKTRVATAAAAEMADRHPDGVWFVDLVPAVDTPDVATVMADATGLQIPGRDIVTGLAEVLAGRDTLFVIDNCEHLTDAVAEVLDVLLTSTSAPRFLATSREPLELYDEVHFALDPLDASDAHSPAVELFVEAAGRVGWRPVDGELDVVASICAHLDGHPLSIELAAAQLKQLTATELDERLDRRFELLTRGRGRRQESLIAVLEDTWGMLDPAEQRMLSQLAAFPSSFDLGDVEGVCATLDVGLPSRTFGGLVDRSVVSPAGDGRHRLLETVKLFVRGHWADDTAVERHEAWLIGYLRTQPTQARYTSLDLSDWLTEHFDDWLSVERRLAAAERWADLGELLLLSQTLFHTGVSGAQGFELLTQVEWYLEHVPSMDDRWRATLNLTAADLGLVARRPDWIERGSAAAVDLYPGGSVERAYSLILHSWMAAFGATDRAVEMLDEAIRDAEVNDAPEVADVALAYRANHLGLAGRAELARADLDALDARLDSDEFTYPRRLHLMVSMSVNIVGEPEAAYRDASELTRRDDKWPHLAAGPVAASGHLGEAHRLFERAVERRGNVFPDDGLPDLLVPVAAAAYAVGDHDRCRTLLTAVRNAPRPTQNFVVTIQYRELRNAVGLDAENPLDTQPIEDLFAEACAWFSAVVEKRGGF